MSVGLSVLLCVCASVCVCKCGCVQVWVCASVSVCARTSVCYQGYSWCYIVMQGNPSRDNRLSSYSMSLAIVTQSLKIPYFFITHLNVWNIEGTFS